MHAQTASLIVARACNLSAWQLTLVAKQRSPNPTGSHVLQGGSTNLANGSSF